MKQTLKVCCGRCGSMLAMRTASEEVSFRFEDARREAIFIWALGGVVVLWCKGCAASNVMADEEYEQLHPEIVAGLLKRLCTFRVVVEVWKSKKELDLERKGEKANV